MLQKNEGKYIQDIVSKRMSRDVVRGPDPGAASVLHACVGMWGVLLVDGGDGCTA